MRFDVTGGRGFAFQPGTVVAYSDARIAPVVGRFCAQIARRTGLSLTPVQDSAVPDGPSVTIELTAGPNWTGSPPPPATSAGEASPGEASPGEASTAQIDVPAARIGDGPRYAWRGLSLDVARTFFTVEEIRRVIDLLELYKLNVLHLHLTDDQA